MPEGEAPHYHHAFNLDSFRFPPMNLTPSLSDSSTESFTDHPLKTPPLSARTTRLSSSISPMSLPYVNWQGHDDQQGEILDMLSPEGPMLGRVDPRVFSAFPYESKPALTLTSSPSPLRNRASRSNPYLLPCDPYALLPMVHASHSEDDNGYSFSDVTTYSRSIYGGRPRMEEASNYGLSSTIEAIQSPSPAEPNRNHWSA